MVRKSKDLFVILAERQRRGKNGKDAAAAVREVGGTLGRWVQGAVKTMRPDREAKAKPKSKAASSKPGKSGKSGETREKARPRPRRTAPIQVPRGLLVPGWLLIGMVTAAIGCGFLVGRYTSGNKVDALLSGGAAKPGVFEPKPADLSPDEEIEELSAQFYVCGTYFPEEREKAAELARSLRNHGIANTRFRAFKSKDGSISAWGDPMLRRLFRRRIRDSRGPKGPARRPRLRSLVPKRNLSPTGPGLARRR